MSTLPDSDTRVPAIKKKLRVVCMDEAEHVAWGEKETARILSEQPRLATPFYGLFELQMATLPLLVRALRSQADGHPVLQHLDGFVEHVRTHAYAQGRRLGYVPSGAVSGSRRASAMALGLLLYTRSRFARSRSNFPHTYLTELGFDGAAAGTPGNAE